MKRRTWSNGRLRCGGIELFSSGMSVILIFMCGIAVSSSPAVCGFSSFRLTVFGKRSSFTDYCGTVYLLSSISIECRSIFLNGYCYF